MATTTSYVISVDSIPRGRRHVPTSVVYVGRHAVTHRSGGAHRAGRRADAGTADRRGADGMRVRLARLDAAWLGQPAGQAPDDFSYGGGRHRATPAEARRRRAERTRHSRRAVVVRSCLAALLLVFVAALVAGAWFSTSGAMALASMVQP